MEVPESVRELLKNPIFKGVDVKNLENAINKTFDKNLCEQVSLVEKYTDKCVYPLSNEEKNKIVDNILADNDKKLPKGMTRNDIIGAVDYINSLKTGKLKEVQFGNMNSLLDASKFMNTNFSPDAGDKKCADNCVNNINKMVGGIKTKITANATQFQKFDNHLSDYYAASLLFHNAFYSLLTFYKYKNSTSGVNSLNDIVKKLKYKNTTSSPVAKFFVNRMATLIKNYKSDIGSFDYQYSIFSRVLPVTIVEIGISKTARVAADKKLIEIIGKISNQITPSSTQVKYSINKKNADDSLIGDIMDAYGVKPTENEAKDPNYIKNKQNQLYSLLVSTETKIKSQFNQTRDNAKKIGYNFYTLNKNTYTKYIQTLADNFIKKHELIISILENVDIDIITKDVKKQLSQMLCCGKKLEADDKVIEYKKDENNKTYSGVNAESDITRNEYWKEFTKYLNIIALLPIYWKIGLYIPTPAGIVKVPLPIIFIHLITIKIGPVIIVIWLTINGMVIVPVVFTLQFLPIADSASVWLVLFRGVNKKIKDKTGVEVLNLPIVGGININPVASKLLPFKKDDLPTIERLSITNPLYVLYLNQMLQKATPSMGLP